MSMCAGVDLHEYVCRGGYAGVCVQGWICMSMCAGVDMHEYVCRGGSA